MSKDDPRKHGGNTPGMVPGRGHEHFEDEVRLNHREPGEDQPGTTGGRTHDSTDDVTDRHQPSALGGHTATTTGREKTPADER